MGELDNTTVRRATEGDHAAAAELFAAISPGVVRYCWARLGTLDTSAVSPDDVAQDVCLAVFQALDGYEDRGLPFLAFVYRIAAYKVTDAYRAAHRATAVRPIDGVADPVDELPGPERRAVDADLLRRVATLLDRLSGTQREIIVLRVAVGLSAEEVGAVLGMAASAVRMAQSRALTRLRGWARESVGEVVVA